MTDELARELIDAIKQTNEKLASIAMILEEGLLTGIASAIAEANCRDELKDIAKTLQAMERGT
jgi:hypothetical protein